MIRSAIISDCLTYRYRLERDMERPGKTAFIGMVNPSTADHEVEDNTITRLIGFSDRLGVGRFIVANKFAFRSKDVSDLKTAADPVGPQNDGHIEQAMRDADLHIVAWGPVAKLPTYLRSRWRTVIKIAAKVGCPLYCLGTAQDGHPRHPLMLSYATPLIEWKAP